MDDNTFQPYVEDDIRLCTMRHFNREDKFGVHWRYHAGLKFHYITLWGDQRMKSKLAGIKPFDRIIELDGINVEQDTIDQFGRKVSAKCKALQPISLLLTNPSTYEYYKQHGITIDSNLLTVKRMKPILRAEGTMNLSLEIVRLIFVFLVGLDVLWEEMKPIGTLFEQLQTELVYCIFDYLKNGDMMESFFGLNSRFARSSIGYCRSVDLQDKSEKTVVQYLDVILPYVSYDISELKIDGSHLKRIFQSIEFANLTRLVINRFNVNHFIPYLDRFIKLKQLNINHVKCGPIKQFSRDIFQHLFSSRTQLNMLTLTNIEHGMIIPLSTSTSPCSIKQLTIHLKYFDETVALLRTLPALEQLCIHVDKPIRRGVSRWKRLTWPTRSLKEFQLYTNNNVTVSYEKVEYLLSKLNSIEKLTLHIPNLVTTELTTVDGDRLRTGFLSKMVNLKIFHFYLSCKQTQPPASSSFTTDFWVKEHSWNVSNYLSSNNQIWTVFTSPYHFETIYINCIKLPSIASIFNNSRQWNTVKIAQLNQLYQSTSFFEKLEETCHNLNHLKFSSYIIDPADFDDRTNNEEFEFHSVDCLTFATHPTADNRSIRVVEKLLHRTPNLRELSINYSVLLKVTNYYRNLSLLPIFWNVNQLNVYAHQNICRYRNGFESFFPNVKKTNFHQLLKSG